MSVLRADRCNAATAMERALAAPPPIERQFELHDLSVAATIRRREGG